MAPSHQVKFAVVGIYPGAEGEGKGDGGGGRGAVFYLVFHHRGWNHNSKDYDLRTDSRILSNSSLSFLPSSISFFRSIFFPFSFFKEQFTNK